MSFYTDHLSYFQQVCFYLGPAWRVNQNAAEHSHSITLINSEFRFFEVVAWQDKDKIRLAAGAVRSVYPYGERAVCHFSALRQPRSVAGDINKKLISAMAEINTKAVVHIQEKQQVKEQDQILLHLLSRVAQVSDGWHQTFCSIDSPSCHGSVSKRYNQTFDLSLSKLSKDSLIKVVAFIGQLEVAE